MKKIIIGLLVIVSCLFLSGCYSSYNYSGESGSIVGSWIKNNRVYNFNSDGTCSYYEGEDSLIVLMLIMEVQYLLLGMD